MQSRPLSPKKLKRTIFNKRLLESTLAIFKYIPKAIVTKKLNGMDFYRPETIEGFKNRALSASVEISTAWGTMNQAQIFHHLNLAFGSALGYFDLPDESYLFGRTFVKWLLVDWFPEQPKGLRLPLSFVITHDQIFNFEKEQQLFVEILEKAGHTKQSSDWNAHPYFGYLSYNEWGQTCHCAYGLPSKTAWCIVSNK